MELNIVIKESRSTKPSLFLVFRWSVCVSDVLSHNRDFEDPNDAVLSRGKMSQSVTFAEDSRDRNFYELLVVL